MLPYQPNSDALLPPPALPPLRAEPVLSLPLSDDDSVFPLTIFALFFFSLLASVWSPIDFGGLDLGCVDDLVAFANILDLKSACLNCSDGEFAFAVVCLNKHKSYIKSPNYT